MKKKILMVILGCSMLLTACDNNECVGMDFELWQPKQESQNNTYPAHDYMYVGVEEDKEVYQCMQCGDIKREPIGTFIDGYETED